MIGLYYIIKRNILIYIRDKTSVFFSLLSMLIVIGLMVLFLGNMNRDEVVYILEKYGGQRDKALDLANATNLIQVWTIAGLLVVNSLTVSLTMIGMIVEDEAKNRIESFYVAPIKRSRLALGYVSASIIMASLICMITLAISQAYLFLTDSTVFTVQQVVQLLVLIIVNVFVYSSLLFLIAIFVHSVSAWSTLGSLIGTLVGFVGAIYLPMGMLPESVQNVLKCLPILHGISLTRQISTQIALENTFLGLPEEVSKEYQRYMGITVEVKDRIISSGSQFVFLIVCSVLALIVASILLKRREIKNR
ncbi:ABC transporter permease [Candidatus Galacturonibacter soehngenii]|uniref:ABC transporter permease n=1 Tax=Candidatus Galacturonatibacter soehngenii TaxID=2307010 RepID=A0A7V7UDG7_9FIRM|nr:ABC transporter permease [Candidatus Galacturonibacter soehngenii]KAB1440562.1 ABC transporter permease [Candidatus Galacturonibacter soehngenii]